MKSVTVDACGKRVIAVVAMGNDARPSLKLK